MSAYFNQCSTLWGVCGILRQSRLSHAGLVAKNSALGPRITTTRMVSNPLVPGCFLLVMFMTNRMFTVLAHFACSMHIKL